MSASLNKVVYIAIQKYLEKNQFHTMSPNLLRDAIQQELAQDIGNAISAYMGKIKHKSV